MVSEKWTHFVNCSFQPPDFSFKEDDDDEEDEQMVDVLLICM